MPLTTSNINRLITEALAIEAEEAKQAGALGYMARALVQATMPHSNPGDVEAWGRENGAFSMVMQPGIMKKNNELIRIGLPYGSIPRLLLSWVTTEALRNKSTKLILGPTLSGFMQQLDLIPAGGRWGTITRLREQMKRLFSASISCYYNENFSNDIKNRQNIARSGFNITKSYQLWWDPKSPNQAALWESEVTLSRDFYDEITSYPVPIDMRVLKALKRSPMALDIYCWLTYRVSYLKHSTQIPWIALKMQFGSSYQDGNQGLRDFKKAFLRELRKVKQFYTLVNVGEGEFGLILNPSLRHIPAENKKIVKQKKSRELENDLRKIYSEYRHTRMLEIIEKELSETEQELFLTEFDNYLIDNNVGASGEYKISNTKISNWLHQFMNVKWPHLAQKLQNFEDFSSEKLTIFKN